MKSFLLFSICLFSFKAFSWEAPEVITNACAEGCTQQMEEMYETYLGLKTAPENTPAMYSGECHHNSDSLDPNTTHYIGLLIDNENGKLTMSPVLQYFGEENDMKDWTLEEARKEMSPDWKTQGKFKLFPTALTSHYDDEEGNPALVYWARQDLKSKDIYFMAYLRGWSTAFCVAHPNN
jgi:hypothetical protein